MRRTVHILVQKNIFTCTFIIFANFKTFLKNLYVWLLFRWILENFAFYRTEDQGWQVSIYPFFRNPSHAPVWPMNFCRGSSLLNDDIQSPLLRTLRRMRQNRTGGTEVVLSSINLRPETHIMYIPDPEQFHINELNNWSHWQTCD